MAAKGAALVRPDGQVARRIAWSGSDATSQLASAVKKVVRPPANCTAQAPPTWEMVVNEPLPIPLARIDEVIE
jgi:hypothetical protein